MSAAGIAGEVVGARVQRSTAPSATAACRADAIEGWRVPKGHSYGADQVRCAL
ncbi:hypothetical protein ENSA5_08710 [Enhygromyxa salina]|uniref:Uncharacterized protein n=1 Tax=Enhygromyxa salina TaxID=215803 RepID=A0A2S9YGR4_9BACT|nr:hypothetical protein [Enhygromyxa salina]PRQ04305.1 hypothetical protein ENSA5_08710 [Enhygromyxa salina]